MNILLFLLLLIFTASPHFSDGQVVIADAVKLTHIKGPEFGEVIVDDSEPGFSTVGSWLKGTFTGGHQNTYLYVNASDTVKSCGNWIINLTTEETTYTVSVWYPAGSNRSKNVLYRILHAEGVNEVVINQTTGGNWTNLGSYHFKNRGYIQISAGLTVNPVYNIVVDDGDILFNTIGSWAPGTNTTGYLGDYLYRSCASTPSSKAFWNIPVFAAGNYEIFAWFNPGSNRNDSAHYLIPFKDGIQKKILDQTRGEDGWHDFGIYPYTPGVYQVELNNTGSMDKVVVADAIICKYNSPPGPIPPKIIPIQELHTPAPGESFSVKAEVWSVSPIRSVKGEKWIADELHEWSNFFDDGLHNDGTAGDGIFGGNISGGPAASVINYRIHADNDTSTTAQSDIMKCLVAYQKAENPELRWIFSAPFYTPELAEKSLADIRRANMNALGASPRSTLYCYYKSVFLPMFSGVPEGYDPLAGLIEKAHDTSGGKAYIQIHTLVLFYVALTSDTPPPGHILTTHPEWTDENYKGEQVITTSINTRMYLDAGIPEVQDYYFDIVMEIVKNYDIDGMNLDHIRYREQNMGYSPLALKYFHQFTGRSDRPLPDDPQWSAWRREQITNIVKRIAANILKEKPDLLLTIDGVNSSAVSDNIEDNVFWNGVFQDYPGWLANHYIDAVLGMAYRNETDPVKAKEFDEWQAFLQRIKGDRDAAVIVGAYQNKIQDTLLQLHRVRQTDSDIISIYSYNEFSSAKESQTSFIEALRSQLFPTPVSFPEFKWKTDRTKGVVMGKIRVGDAPSRRTKVTLGSRETITDLCGFYVFFDVAPGEQELTFYDSSNVLLAKTNVTVNAGSVIEKKFPQPTAALYNLWLLHR